MPPMDERASTSVLKTPFCKNVCTQSYVVISIGWINGLASVCKRWHVAADQPVDPSHVIWKAPNPLWIWKAPDPREGERPESLERGSIRPTHMEIPHLAVATSHQLMHGVPQRGAHEQAVPVEVHAH